MLHHGKCEVVLKEYPDNHFDSCVTDPPYGLSFMNKHWDYQVPSITIWQEILRVMKPGAFILVFGGSRTFHRMAVNIEDAGFEMRDTIMWVYGSGFPKSLDISKAIDKADGNEREIIGEKKLLGHNAGTGAGSFSKNQYEGQSGETRIEPITSPGSDLSEQWEGWGTALKPAFEPILVCRKPLIGTVVDNIKQFGTGGINIDACRVDINVYEGGYSGVRIGSSKLGRFPSNLIHDGSDEVVSLFPHSKSGAMTKPYEYTNTGFSLGKPTGSTKQIHQASEGSAARFFYCAKTSRQDRNEGCEAFENKPINWSSGTKNPGSSQSENTDRSSPNNHPTVKPTNLMRYLVRLVSPKGSLCLDPFMGSGSTGKACAHEGIEFCGIDMDESNIPIAGARIKFALRHKDNQQTLF